MSDRSWIDRLLRLSDVSLSRADGDRLKDLVIDTVAVAAGARWRRTGAAGLDLAAMRPLPAGGVHVWGSDTTTCPMQAAFLNGTAAEALDYQEVLIDGRNNGHAAVVIVPALLALAEDREIAGPRLLQALRLAFVANVSLMRALGRGHRAQDRGFRTTALGAPIAAALGGAFLIGLDADRIAHAVGIAAASLPAGLLASMSPVNGSYSKDKDIAVGLSAQHAVQSVLLAEAGVSGPATPLSGHRGWLASYGFETGQPEMLDQAPPADALGAYAIKIYPANFGCQAAIRAAISLHDQVSIDEIEEVEVRVKTSSAQSLSTKSIVNHLAARFSLPYAVASALVRGTCALADYELPAIEEPTVLNLVTRCNVTGDAGFETIHQQRGVFPGEVAVRCTDGRILKVGFEGPWDGASDADRSAGLSAKARDLLGDAADVMTSHLMTIDRPNGLTALRLALTALSKDESVAQASSI